MPLPSILSSSKKNLFLVGLLAALTFLTFSPVLKAQFLDWEDNVYLTQNADVLNHHLQALFKKCVGGMYVPLSSLSFVLEHRFFGLNPFFYHLDNLLLHILVVLLVFFFALNLGISNPRAFLGAMLFAIVPLHVQTVAWISQRKDLLSAVFYMGALLAFRKDNFLLSLGLGVLSVLANPFALSLPIVLVLCRERSRPASSARLAQGSPRRTGGLFPTIIWPYVLIFIVIGWQSRHSYHAIIFHHWYLAWGVLAVLTALGIGKLNRFLKTQEAVIRYLFYLAIATLISGLILLTYQQTFHWWNPVVFWKYQLKVRPTAMAYNHLAFCLAELGEYDQAKNDYRNYMDLIATGADESKITVPKESLKKIQELIDLYRQAMAMNNKYINAYNNLADLYQAVGRFDDALGVYNQALRLEPSNKDLLFDLSLLYQKMSKPQQSIDTFNRLLKAYPDEEDVYVNVIAAYSKAITNYPAQKEYQEKREQVLSDYEELSKRKKYTAVDYFNLGFLYEQVGGFEEAIRFYKKSLQLNPAYDKALYNLANRYQEQGDFKTALGLYQRLVHFHPRYALGYLNMGVIYNSLGDIDHARMLYQKTLDVDSTNAGAYFNLGYLSQNRGELKEALSFYEKAADNDPQFAESYFAMGNTYAQLGQTAEAIASYLKTIGINKNHLNAYVNLSILSFKSGDFTGAVHYLEEAQLLGYNPPAEYVRALAPYRKNSK